MVRSDFWEERHKNERSPDDTWRLRWRSLFLTLIIFMRPSHKFAPTACLRGWPSSCLPFSVSLPPSRCCQVGQSANKIINCCSALNSQPRRPCRYSGSKHCHKTSTLDPFNPSQYFISVRQRRCPFPPQGTHLLIGGGVWKTIKRPLRQASWAIINGDNDLIGR